MSKPRVSGRSKKSKNESLIEAERFSKRHVLVFLVIFAIIGSYFLLHSFAATPSGANLFVSPNGNDAGANCKRFASLTANPDSGGTSLCATFNKAYQLASPGDTVTMVSGNYGYQAISASAKPLADKITFVPDATNLVKIPKNSSILSSALTLPTASIPVNDVNTFLTRSNGTYVIIVGDRSQITPTTAQTVTCTGKDIATGVLTGCTGGSASSWPAGAPVTQQGGLSVGASNIEIDSLTIEGGVGVQPASTNPNDMTGATFRNVNAYNVFVVANNTSWYGGNVGGYDACQYGSSEDAFRLWQDGSHNVTDHAIISGVTIHDNSVDSGSGATCGGKPTSGLHADCMQLLGATNALIENNIFYNCPTSDILARPYGGANLHGNTVVNNFLGNVLHPGSNAGFGGSGDVCGGTNTIEYNTVNGTVSGYCSEGVTIKANVLLGAPGGCPGTWSYNVMPTHLNSGITCGSPVKVCDPVLADPTKSGGNLRLAATDTCAKGAGDPANYPLDDIDGGTRSSPPTAGAFELASSGSATLPPPDKTAPTIPTNLAKTNATTTSITLSWNASTDSGVGASGVAGYDLYRNGSLLATVTGLSYTDSGLSTNTSYSYTIRATDNAANHSSQSGSVDISTAANTTTPSPTHKPGDCNKDGKVDLTDLSLLLSHYNTAYPAAEFDGNSVVDLTDLSTLLSNYGE